MNLELYTKSRENLIGLFKKDMSDMSHIDSLIRCLENNFAEIEIHKYGADKILESNFEKIHLYTNSELRLPKFISEKDSKNVYIMVYRNKIYTLINYPINIPNQTKIREENNVNNNSKVKNNSKYSLYQVPYIEYPGDKELSSYEIDNYRVNQQLRADDYRDFELGYGYNDEECYSSSNDEDFQSHYYLNEYKYIDYKHATSLADYILTNFGLFMPIADIMLSTNGEKVINLENMIDGIDTKDYYYNENLGLVKEYREVKDLSSMKHDYLFKSISGEYFITYNSITVCNEKFCNNLEEALDYIRDEYKKDIEQNSTIDISDEVSF